MSLQSREFREAVQFEVEKEKERAQETIQQHKDKWVTCWSHDMYMHSSPHWCRLAQQVQQYQHLEDEFRSALRIEGGRYKEVGPVALCPASYHHGMHATPPTIMRCMPHPNHRVMHAPPPTIM